MVLNERRPTAIFQKTKNVVPFIAVMVDQAKRALVLDFEL
jgi:hypothetical protein